MATGDQADVVNRLLALLPPWFPAGAATVLEAVLQGSAWVLSQVYTLIGFARAQTRISTASAGWLDLISYDFFGRSLLRLTNEADFAFATRIKANLLQPAATRPALITALMRLTGRSPVVIDPWRPGDCGAYGYGGLGYGVAGYYGSLSMPAQTFLVVYRPAGGGVSDAGIYQVIVNTIPAGAIAWSALSN